MLLPYKLILCLLLLAQLILQGVFGVNMHGRSMDIYAPNQFCLLLTAGPFTLLFIFVLPVNCYLGVSKRLRVVCMHDKTRQRLVLFL